MRATAAGRHGGLCQPWDLLEMDIDHVLVDMAHFTTTNAHVMDAGHSDHRPVVVTIQTK